MEQNQVQNIPQELFVRVDNNTINGYYVLTMVQYMSHFVGGVDV